MINNIEDGWIEDRYYQRIVFISAKECDFNKAKFKEVVEHELMDNIRLITDIQEGYYRIKKSDDYEKEEYGEYCWQPCKKGKGAVLYYFAGIEFVGGKEE